MRKQLQIGSIQFLSAVLLVTLFGCGGGEGSVDSQTEGGEPSTAPVTLRVLVIDNEGFGESVSRLWSAEGRGELEFVHQSEADFMNSIDDRRPDAEVILYPPHLLGDLVAKQVIGEIALDVFKSEEYDSADVFPLQKEPLTSWAGKHYAFPFGNAHLVLLYRKDIFAKFDLPLPQTWSEYAETVSQIQTILEQGKLKSDGDVDNIPTFATLEPLSSEWRSRTLLARTATYLKHPARISDLFDYASLHPQIADEPFQKSFDDILQLPKASLAKSQELNAIDCFGLMLSNQAAISIAVVPTALDSLDSSEAIEANPLVGVTSLPGSFELYNTSRDRWESRESSDPTRVPLIGSDGMLGSTVFFSRKTVSGQKFLTWLSDKDVSTKLLSSHPHTSMFRKSQRRSLDVWVDQRLSEEAQTDYVDAIELDNNQSLWMPGFRFASGQRYDQSLSEVMGKAFAGESTAKEALTSAANRWEAITSELGRSEQTKSYQGSLQLD